MSTPIRRELDLARLAARERRLRLVMQILRGREAESERTGAPAPAGLRQTIADFGEQLHDVHRRQAELARRSGAGSTERSGRFANRQPLGQGGHRFPASGERS